MAFCFVGFCCSPHQTGGIESREERRSLVERRGRDARDRLRERERIWRKKKAREEEEEKNKKSNGLVLICLSFDEEREECSGERSKRVWKWLWFSGCSRNFVAEVKMSRGGEICVKSVQRD